MSFLGLSCCCVLLPLVIGPNLQSPGVDGAFFFSGTGNPRQCDRLVKAEGMAFREAGAWTPRTLAANELKRRTLWIRVAQTMPGFAALLPDAAKAADLVGARKQLVAAVSKVDDLLANFDAIIAGQGGGDKVLTAFRSTESPLNKLEQKCAQLAVVAQDPEGFQDALEAYSKFLTDADGKAYSSNFAVSGNPNKNNPKVILRAAKESTLAMRKEMDKMLAALGSQP
eukprot:CAMPEP_0171095202 /NCGR_PEP_ID=MMETSP0766_2-20121228/43040_1 /TAXON_ID=439317 /ORGANISM="Gambierdiscus australes, Strain CAWD 149" /LENGTH=225 /DNA_ID=CAMNT_0011553985 /DNA_START=123 /DNA_END=800 /DNA_ORIENTATION=+